MCLELVRILDFIGRPEVAGSVIEENLLRFPDEWKLVLERIQQCVVVRERIHRQLRNGDMQAAYTLNVESLTHHTTAGRLWSSVIQLTHQ